MQAQDNITNYIKVPSFSYACSSPCITLVKKKVSLKNKKRTCFEQIVTTKRIQMYVEKNDQ